MKFNNHERFWVDDTEVLNYFNQNGYKAGRKHVFPHVVHSWGFCLAFLMTVLKEWTGRPSNDCP